MQVDEFANILVDPGGNDSEVDQVKGVENIIADSGNDRLDGGADDDTMTGDAGMDSLSDACILNQTAATVTGDSTVGNTRTVDWSNDRHPIMNG